MARRKKLIEVALPLEAINKESAREKSIRHGHPSTLHLWWARRPLAACRAVLFAQFVDDPDSDPAYRKADGSVDEDAAGLKRAQLFNLIEELVKWENSNNERVINAARAEIARCVASLLIEEGKLSKDTIIHGDDEGQPHSKGPLSGEFRTAWDLVVHGHGDLDGLQQRRMRLCPPDVVNHFLATYAPPVLDPFAGGGSIPLEAQRLGLRAYASDLNPVPVLINKALIEIPPKYKDQPPVNTEWQNKSSQEQAVTSWARAEGIAQDVRYYGRWMRAEAEKRIAHLYPAVKITSDLAKDRPDLQNYVGQELPVISWLWARTVPSPDPSAGEAHVPLLRTFMLSTKKGREAYAYPLIDRDSNCYEFTIRLGRPPATFDADAGTVSRRGGKCILTNASMPFPHIRQHAKQGRMGIRLLAIAVLGRRERLLVPPLVEHETVARSAAPAWRPEAPMPLKHRNFQPPVYGMETMGDIFTDRQLVALNTLADTVGQARQNVAQDAANAGLSATTSTEYADAVATYLAEAVSKTTAFHCSLATWRTDAMKTGRAFGRQAIPMTWDFAEVNPFVDAGGSWNELFESAEKTIRELPACAVGSVQQRDATAPFFADDIIISTDPPYYDNVAYAELSDFYYPWLRRTLRGVYPELFATVATPKTDELVAAPHRYGGNKREARDFFEDGLREVFRQAKRAAARSAPIAVYYAFKQAESAETSSGDAVASTGWETMLEGLCDAELAVNATWPMRTESVVGLKSVFNSLASSIVLACTPRSEDSIMTTRRDFLNALKRELPDAVRKLRSGNIAPVDLAQAAIGPGMSVYSRYSKVVESDGSKMVVRTALALINQVLDEVLAEQEGEFDGDTRWAVAWFEQYGTQDGPYGVAETLSKAKNTSVQGLVEAGVITARGGKVELLARDGMPGDWDPRTDTRMTCWEATQHLIRHLQNEGEESAAQLLARLGGDYGEMARDLAYRLYSICERKGWAQEALAYNSLVIAWSEISRLSRSVAETKPTQADLF